MRSNRVKRNLEASQSRLDERHEKTVIANQSMVDLDSQRRSQLRPQPRSQPRPQAHIHYHKHESKKTSPIPKPYSTVSTKSTFTTRITSSWALVHYINRNWYISPVHDHEPMIITTVSTTAMTTSTTTVVITSASTSSVNEAKCSSSSFEKRDLCFEDNRSHNYSLENIFSEKLSFVASHINERPTFFCQNLQLHFITRRFLSLYLLLDF